MNPSLLEKAKEHLFQGDFLAAKDLLSALTKPDSSNRIEAHRLLGLFGLEGMIPGLSEQEAIAHLKQAAEAGDGEAVVVLWERTKDPVWKEPLILAAKNGDEAAIDALVKIEGERFFCRFGYLDGIALLKKAIANDRVEAMLLLASTWKEERNPFDAVRLWRRAAALGSFQAHVCLAEASPDWPTKIVHYETAAKEGHVESMRRLADHYALTERYEDRFRMLRLLAQAGDEEAISRLFDDCVEKGKFDQAIKYGKRLKLDEAKKAFRLAPLYERIGDDEEAIRHYGIAAEGRIPSAMFELGMRLLQGRGVQPNATLAAKWIAKAAEVCHPEAVYQMGRLYEEGIGVPKDDALAVFWYDHAITYGHKEAKTRRTRLAKASRL